MAGSARKSYSLRERISLEDEQAIINNWLDNERDINQSDDEDFDFQSYSSR